MSLSPHPSALNPTQSQSRSVTLLKMVVGLAEYIEFKGTLRNIHTGYFDGLERIFEQALIKIYLKQIDFFECKSSSCLTLSGSRLSLTRQSSQHTGRLNDTPPFI
jgi:hypothetical protein